MALCYARKHGSLFLALATLSSLLGLRGAAAAAGTAAPLRALVPLKTSFTEFVAWSGSPHNATFNGFAVETFRTAALRFSSPLHYTLVPVGDGVSDPFYDDMIQMLEQGKGDVIVADLTINVDRLKLVDFTQPYMPSALLMVTPFRYGRIGTMWDFLQPFSTELWVVIMLAFFGTGIVMFILEHKNPDFQQFQLKSGNEDDDASPEHTRITQNWSTGFTKWVKRLVNFYWFTSLTVFFSQQESVMTHAGRFVTVVWLLVVLIFTSSYTASLASTLSAQEPYPTIQGFEFLLKSHVPIGYQGGSFIKNYLTMLGIKESRLVSLDSEDQFARALRLGPNAGGVGAVVDEQPYVQTFLSTECDFTVVGDQVAFFGGFGFAFAKNSSLTDAMSIAILSLVQDGTLQRLKDKWVGPSQCNVNALAISHMKLSSFGGLFIILGAVYVICVVWRFLTLQVKSKPVQARIGSLTRVLMSPASQRGGAPAWADARQQARQSNGVV